MHDGIGTTGGARLESEQEVKSWQRDIHRVFGKQNVRQLSYVPDAGHKGLIRLCDADNAITTTVLTTEAEGPALAAGLWLGGEKSVLLMQSSGVGNCINMFTLVENCRMPFVMLVTMRGEWGEFIPWQVPMGKRTPTVLEAMDFDVYRAERGDEVGDMVEAGIEHAYFSNRRVAILMSQKMIGRKNWSQ